jgi:hypothetical protein
MIARCMRAACFGAYFVAYVVGYFVTGRLGATTHCHDNFGYYLVKYLIPCVVMSDRTGPRYALEGKVVYSR